MTKQQYLESLVQDIAQLTGGAASRDEAKEKGLDKFLYIDYASVYGGYRLINVNVEGGGHSGSVMGSSVEKRVTYANFCYGLTALIAGLKFKQSM